jgi:hypothetical protein
MTTAINLLLLVQLSAQAPSAPPPTHVLMRLQQMVSTRTARLGTPVHLRTVTPIVTDGLFIPTGSYARGAVVRCDRPGRVRGRAALEIAVESITMPDGTVLRWAGRSPVMEPPRRLPPPPFVRDQRAVVPIMIGMATMYGTTGLVSQWSDSEDVIYNSAAVAGLAAGILSGVLKRGDHLVLLAGSTIEVEF